MTDRRSILLCEDNEEMIMVTAYFLRSRSFIVIVARTTEEVKQFLKENTASVILLDLNLPSEGGETLFKQLKQDDRTKSIPVLLFSANSRLEKIASDLGAEGYLIKPFDLNQMIHAINTVTGFNSMPS